ncbi:MAG: 5-formyltetrahydrofolate cyclo-ligase [Gordonia sp. (in: high G+C Gram-positive bacteria)]|nr:5-formyltetrahydrofolate cyclo-ligase [Gordonia sp. (in: high G+C Gram-positive bacteria)]
MTATKKERRADLLAARGRMSPFVIAQVNAELAEWMYALPVPVAPGDTVAAYVAVGDEPGGTAMLDALVDRGLRVLLPVVPAGAPTALQWGEFRGEDALVHGRWDLLEPADSLGVDAVAEARAILVPAIGADRAGGRLGRGAGYYDRTLDATHAPIIAVVYDDELLESIPQEPNDVPVDWVLTPGGGFLRTPHRAE